MKRPRRAVPVFLGAAAIVLVPWIAWLASSLPCRYVSQHWGIAWAGIVAAWCFPHNRPLKRLAATIGYPLLAVLPTDWLMRNLDPIVIAVIPTAPNRGLWCSLGAWLH